jgi:GNAT superfamily N-acetyltransferase
MSASHEVRIEPATLDDLPQLTELLVELFTQEPDFRPDRDAQMRGLRLILEQPNRGRVFVARDPGSNYLIGMVNLLFTISTAEGGFVILLEDLMIHPQHRGRGFGTMLLDYSIRYAREKNFLRITLLTDKVDHPSVRFFEKLGFRRSEMVPMRLLLNTPGEAPRSI